MKKLLLFLIFNSIFASDSTGASSSNASPTSLGGFNHANNLQIYIKNLLHGLFGERQIDLLGKKLPSFASEIEKIKTDSTIRQKMFEIIKDRFTLEGFEWELKVAKAIVIDGFEAFNGKKKYNSIAFEAFIIYLEHQCLINNGFPDLPATIELECSLLLQYPYDFIGKDEEDIVEAEDNLLLHIKDAHMKNGDTFDMHKIIDYNDNERKILAYVMCLMINALKREYYEMVEPKIHLDPSIIELSNKIKSVENAKKEIEAKKRQEKKARQRAKKQSQIAANQLISMSAAAAAKDNDEEIIVLEMDKPKDFFELAVKTKLPDLCETNTEINAFLKNKFKFDLVNKFGQRKEKEVKLVLNRALQAVDNIDNDNSVLETLPVLRDYIFNNSYSSNSIIYNFYKSCIEDELATKESIIDRIRQNLKSKNLENLNINEKTIVDELALRLIVRELKNRSEFSFDRL